MNWKLVARYAVSIIAGALTVLAATQVIAGDYRSAGETFMRIAIITLLAGMALD